MIKHLRRLLGRGAENDVKAGAQRSLEAAKQAALQPVLYADWGVPDSFDGRFEAVLLMTAVEFARLKRDEKAAQADRLLVEFMQDIELALQTTGVSESGMRKKMRAVEISTFARVEQVTSALLAEQPMTTDLRAAIFGKGEEPAETLVRLDALAHLLYAHPKGLSAATSVMETL